MKPALISCNARTAVRLVMFMVIATTGCKDLGLKDNIPLAEAEIRPPRYVTYQMSQSGAPGAAVLTLHERTWMMSGRTERIPERLLVPAGDAAGSQVFALATDAPPYTRLYTRAQGDRWNVYVQTTVSSH
jgi:hypothetical protein